MTYAVLPPEFITAESDRVRNMAPGDAGFVDRWSVCVGHRGRCFVEKKAILKPNGGTWTVELMRHPDGTFHIVLGPDVTLRRSYFILNPFGIGLYRITSVTVPTKQPE